MRFLTAGESHGRALVGILEGMPSNLSLTLEHLHAQLRRRKLGFGRGARQAIETDHVEFLSGVRHGRTLASPIAVLLWNKDWANWQDIMLAEPLPAAAGAAEAAGTPGAGNFAEDGVAKGGLTDGASNEQAGAGAGAEIDVDAALRRVRVPRPGHADRIGGLKYGHRDMRNVLERSSARETAMRVALGAVARTLLEALGVQIGSRVVRIGEVEDTDVPTLPAGAWNPHTDASPARCLSVQATTQMVAAIERAKAAGDTLGGTFEVVATGVPLGLGSYVHWDRRLEAAIGQAFLSLNAIKGVEVGMGFEVARRPGSRVHDALEPGGQKVHYRTNHAGGIEGGMSTGQPLVVRAAMKPLSTLMQPIDSVDSITGRAAKAHVERSDVCAVPAAAVIGEALLALVLAEELLKTYPGDTLGALQAHVAASQALASTGPVPA